MNERVASNQFSLKILLKEKRWVAIKKQLQKASFLPQPSPQERERKREALAVTKSPDTKHVRSGAKVMNNLWKLV